MKHEVLKYSSTYDLHRHKMSNFSIASHYACFPVASFTMLMSYIALNAIN